MFRRPAEQHPQRSLEFTLIAGGRSLRQRGLLGLPDLGGSNGWHFVPDDLEASYWALYKALSSSQQTRQRKTQAARQSVANLTVPQVAAQVVAAVNAVLSDESTAGAGRGTPARRLS